MTFSYALADFHVLGTKIVGLADYVEFHCMHGERAFHSSSKFHRSKYATNFIVQREERFYLKDNKKANLALTKSRSELPSNAVIMGSARTMRLK